MNNTTVGVDLAKDVIQLCTFSQGKIISNIEMSINDFIFWLINTKPCRIIFEACGTSNYWKQRAIEPGHQALLISASLLPNVKFIQGKTIVQQQLQSLMRIRELSVK